MDCQFEYSAGMPVGVCPLPVTVVVPVRDEAETLDCLLGSVGRQTWRPHHVCFVDAGSTDGTVQLLRQANRSPGGFDIIEAGPASPGRARNIGIAKARTEWVALTDAGIELDPHWLERLATAALRRPEADVVFGSFDSRRTSFFEACADLAYVPPLRSTSAGPVRTRSIASCLLRKRAWEAAGHFPDLRSCEDLIFMKRLEETGCHIVFAPEARVTWQLQPTVTGTFERFRSYSRSTVRGGLQETWHHSVIRQYAVLSALVVLSLTTRRRSVLSLVPLGLAARTTRTIARRREGRSIWFVVRPMQFLSVAGILVLIDLAMLLGWLEELWDSRASRGLR